MVHRVRYSGDEKVEVRSCEYIELINNYNMGRTEQRLRKHASYYIYDSVFRRIEPFNSYSIVQSEHVLKLTRTDGIIA
jgi:hypothetical protein